MTNTSGGAPIRVGELIVESYRLLFNNWRACLVALALPALINTLVTGALVEDAPPAQQGAISSEQAVEQLVGEENLLRMLAMLVVNVIATTLFAVSWHRLALLGEKPRPIPRVGSEHMRFAWLSLALMFVTTLITLSGATLAVSGAAGLAVLLAVVLVVVIYLKLSMMFPAAALDTKCSVARSWSMTKGSAFKLFWAILAAVIPAAITLGVLGLIFSVAITAVFQETALSVWLFLALQSVLSYIPWALTIGIISLAYRQLAGQARAAGPRGGSYGA